MALVRAGALNDAETVIKHRIVEGSMVGGEIVRALGSFMARKHAVLAPVPGNDVDTATLDVVASQPRAPGVAVERAGGKLHIEQA